VPVRRCKHKQIEPAHRHDPDRLNRSDGTGAACVLTREPGIKLREKDAEGRKEFVLSAHRTQFPVRDQSQSLIEIKPRHARKLKISAQTRQCRFTDVSP
jgi:hypothetical protein